MGLDQYGGWLNEPTKEEILHTKIVNEPEYVEIVEFDWRKHAKLQKFMEDLWYNKYGYEEQFNCQNMPLDEEDILALQTAVKDEKLPESKGGMFFGHQFQGVSATEYKEQDLEFCTAALKWIEEGKIPYYSCWW